MMNAGVPDSFLNGVLVLPDISDATAIVEFTISQLPPPLIVVPVVLE
jgi:hypothetical protein